MSVIFPEYIKGRKCSLGVNFCEFFQIMDFILSKIMNRPRNASESADQHDQAKEPNSLDNQVDIVTVQNDEVNYK